ncbi:hypothetical protein ACFYWN_43160 [Streptomyces sp. NPDC002917]|uniref:hypothetical protein n=1 Tax=Streptomyces sp. NPDC002917 TaxID=3364671 RepID=UPI0036ABC18D
MVSSEPSAAPVLQHKDLYDIRATLFGGQYFDIDDDGIRTRDVVTGETLRPDEIPPALLLDPALSAGFDYLRTRGKQNKLTVELLLAPHSKARDFTLMPELHPETMAEPPVMGIEANWVPHDGVTSPLPDQIELRPVPPATGRGAFQQEQISWLRTHSKTILPCELADTDPSPLAQSLHHLWYGIYEKAAADQTMTPPQREAACLIARQVYQATRQWAILGQLGHWLHRLDTADQLPTGHLTALLMLGSWHHPSLHRLNLLHVPAHAHTTPDSPEDTPTRKAYGNTWMHTLRTMRMDMDFLQTPLPY